MRHKVTPPGGVEHFASCKTHRRVCHFVGYVASNFALVPDLGALLYVLGSCGPEKCCSYRRVGIVLDGGCAILCRTPCMLDNTLPPSLTCGSHDTTTVPSPALSSVMIALKLLARLPCEIFTPFGSPVDPEVYCKNANEARSTPAGTTTPPPPAAAAAAVMAVASSATTAEAEGDDEVLGSGLSVTSHWRLSGQRESSPVSLALIADICGGGVVGGARHA